MPLRDPDPSLRSTPYLRTSTSGLTFGGTLFLTSVGVFTGACFSDPERAIPLNEKESDGDETSNSENESPPGEDTIEDEGQVEGNSEEEIEEGKEEDSNDGEASVGTNGSDEDPSSDCVEHRDCKDRSTPFCLEGSCTGCDEAENGDQFCAQRFGEGEDPAPACNSTGGCVFCTAENSQMCSSPEKPICDEATQSCVECTENQKEACSEARPQCEPTSQTCVECYEPEHCAARSLICDVENGYECRACVKHSECGEAGCDQRSGACLPADNVWWVDNNAACDGREDGSESSPYCTIEQAMAHFLKAGAQGTIHLIGGSTAYSESIELNSGMILALLGSDRPVVNGGGNMVISATTESSIYVDNVRIANGSQSGINCDKANVWMEETIVQGNNFDGISAINGCSIRIHRGVLLGNSRDGLAANGCSVEIHSSIVARNGDIGASRFGLHLLGSSFTDLRYLTIAENKSNADGDAIACAVADTVNLKNSIVFSGSDAKNAIDCNQSKMNYNVVDDVDFSLDAGSTNLVVSDAYQRAWFANPEKNNFHLGTPPESWSSVASFGIGDPEFDLDNEARTQADSSSHVGADELH